MSLQIGHCLPLRFHEDKLNSEAFMCIESNKINWEAEGSSWGLVITSIILVYLVYFSVFYNVCNLFWKLLTDYLKLNKQIKCKELL